MIMPLYSADNKYTKRFISAFVAFLKFPHLIIFVVQYIRSSMKNREKYVLQNHVRIVTAASLFDGHDAAINIMRRILQATGAEVIHLGHNRSVEEVVNCAQQEDAQAIAATCYQGGHMEYFKYMYDLLKERNCTHIKIFGGGGGVI